MSTPQKPPGTQSKPSGGPMPGTSDAGAQVTSGSSKEVKAGFGRPEKEKRT